ncbi:hypothetical protein [Leptodesmis sp.]
MPLKTTSSTSRRSANRSNPEPNQLRDGDRAAQTIAFSVQDLAQ